MNVSIYNRNHFQSITITNGNNCINSFRCEPAAECKILAAKHDRRVTIGLFSGPGKIPDRHEPEGDEDDAHLRSEETEENCPASSGDENLSGYT